MRRSVAAVRYLLGSVEYALRCALALFAGLICLLSCVVGVGLLLAPIAVTEMRRVARLDRSRAAGRLGRHIDDAAEPAQLPIRQVVRDREFYRDLGRLVAQAVTGVLAGGFAILTVVGLVDYATLPLGYFLEGSGNTIALGGVTVRSWGHAWAYWPIGTGICAALTCRTLPALADLDARLALQVWRVPERVRLARRVEQLADTRADALDAHGNELRRIERDLHDGAQAQLVSVTMRLGLAERQLAADPQQAAQLILDARSSAEDALADLRDIVRGMYPPVLTDRGLNGAITALAARCAVPTAVSADDIGRAPAAVESAAYFIAAETLTNIAKHSAAEHAIVRLRRDGSLLVVEVTDDGHGGADESLGSGLNGIRRRAAALDGRMDLWSPLGGPTVLRVELPCGADLGQLSQEERCGS